MKILILGGSGHIGKRLTEMLKALSWAMPVSASRTPQGNALSGEFLQLDALDKSALQATLKDFDAVVNCVAGDARSISVGARVLTQAAVAAQCPRIVHLSTMSVYGPVEGEVYEDAPLNPGLGWYGNAKCEAENYVSQFVNEGGQAVVLRPGCVFGPGSELWVGRVGRWLQARRLGDLGIAGDGWSNLVHVDDVCASVIAALRLPLSQGAVSTFNLAAPDSPRWNDYFVELALAIKAVPVRRVSPYQLKIDAWIGGPIFKSMRSALFKASGAVQRIPEPLSPGLVALFSRHLRLDSCAAEQALNLIWTPYVNSFQESLEWYRSKASE